MKKFLASLLLIMVVVGIGYGIATYKIIKTEIISLIPMAEPAVAVTAFIVVESQFQKTTTTVGTVKAKQSILLRNEVDGVIQKITLVSGQIVKRGDILVQLEASVEIAETKIRNAELILAKLRLSKVKDAFGMDVGTDLEVLRRQTEYDVALAMLERAKSYVSKKTLVAPFDARVGIVDIHQGQYLDSGTKIVDLQSIDDTVYVDFYVSQEVAMKLKVGGVILGSLTGDSKAIEGKIVAVDSIINKLTRNAKIRTEFNLINKLRPGGSVMMKVPVGQAYRVPSVPVTALRRSPEGAHVFVIITDKQGQPRAELRKVISGQMQADQIFIHQGLKIGERVVAKGSFKIREMALLNIKVEK